MNQEQTNITTGKQIRHLRTQLGMTQEELAGELNVTRQALSNWEREHSHVVSSPSGPGVFHITNGFPRKFRFCYEMKADEEF